MKQILAPLLFSLIFLARLSAADPIEGVWGGKWDDKWPVFLVIDPGPEPGTYQVQYILLENLQHKDYVRQEKTGKKIGDYYQAGFLTYKLIGDSLMVYGGFGNPRMANMVKISTGVPEIAACDEALAKNGWTAKAIPAKEALEKITGN